jgi:hypothetical protein
VGAARMTKHDVVDPRQWMRCAVDKSASGCFAVRPIVVRANVVDQRDFRPSYQDPQAKPTSPTSIRKARATSERKSLSAFRDERVGRVFEADPVPRGTNPSSSAALPGSKLPMSALSAEAVARTTPRRRPENTKSPDTRIHPGGTNRSTQAAAIRIRIVVIRPRVWNGFEYRPERFRHGNAVHRTRASQAQERETGPEPTLTTECGKACTRFFLRVERFGIQTISAAAYSARINYERLQSSLRRTGSLTRKVKVLVRGEGISMKRLSPPGVAEKMSELLTEGFRSSGGGDVGPL